MRFARCFPGLARFYLWQVDGAVRYAPAVRILRQHARPGSSILEVGSGPVGITLFLPRPVTGCDLDFTGPDLGWLRRVVLPSAATRLPFGDRSFEFVLAMDVVEHVPAARRGDFIRELVRVARWWLILSAPCGPIAQACDAELYRWLRTRIGMDHRWLREHVEQGLPDAHQIEALLRSCLSDSDPYELAVQDNFAADRWLWCWKFQSSRNRFWRSFKNKLLWPLAGWLGRSDAGPPYRKVFVLRRMDVAGSAQAA